MGDLDFAPSLIGGSSSSDSVPSAIGGGVIGSVGTRFLPGLRASRPSADAAGLGFLYYATDQVAFYVSDGSAWHRIGPSACGDIIWTAETTARPGYVLLDGSAILNSGAYVDLYALWGGTLPDVEGRTFAAVGPHVDMATILNNEGVALAANRRQKHRTTNALTTGIGTLAATIGTLAATLGSLVATRTADVTLNDPQHHHTINGGASSFLTTPTGTDTDAGSGTLYSKIAATDNSPTGITVSQQPTFSVSGTPGLSGGPSLSGAPALGGSIGTNVAADPIDSGAYIVLQPQAKL